MKGRFPAARTDMFNTLIANLLPHMPKSLVWRFSRRYIAGENLDEAMAACRELNAGGMKVTVDLLGEFIHTLDEAARNRDEYLRIVDRLQAEGIDGNYSLKPTSFGLLLDREACYRNIREVVARAASHGNFVRVDMEDTSCTSAEIELYGRLRAEFPRSVGLVLQAYLRRTAADIGSMLQGHTESSPVNFRLCKGIYVEPESEAFRDREEIINHYLEDLETLLRGGVYVGIATHDRRLVEGALALIEKYKVPRDRCEFQMLYGVTPELRRSVLEKGHVMRVYVPFGREWFAYSTRRLKENPSIASHIVKALFFRG